jgi:hypothetical protein
MIFTFIFKLKRLHINWNNNHFIQSSRVIINHKLKIIFIQISIFKIIFIYLRFKTFILFTKIRKRTKLYILVIKFVRYY